MLAGTFLLYLVGCGSTTPTDVALRTVTINADDPASGTRIDPVNVWRDYNDRSAGVAGRVRHGDRVGLIRQDGGAALIRLNDGTQGWVNAQFIAELR
jgi:hypothetical protein